MLDFTCLPQLLSRNPTSLQQSLLLGPQRAATVPGNPATCWAAFPPPWAPFSCQTTHPPPPSADPPRTCKTSLTTLAWSHARLLKSPRPLVILALTGIERATATRCFPGLSPEQVTDAPLATVPLRAPGSESELPQIQLT